MHQLRPFSAVFTLAIIVACSAIGSAFAQEPETTDGDNAPSASKISGTVERSKTTILFARDEETGRLLPVFDLTLKELARLKRLQDENARENTKPQFHFAEATITGEVEKDKASLKLVYDIVSHETGWIRVPLSLGDTVIVSAEFEGNAEQFVEYDDSEANYFAWINAGEANSVHRVTINLLTRVLTVGNEQRLSLQLPRVVGSSNTPTMTLKVPVESATAFANSGGQACPLETKPMGKSTELTILQPGGDFTASWRSTKRTTDATTLVVFDTSSEVVLNWDSQSRITWNANIDLSVRTGELTSVVVDLPVNARLVEQDVTGQRVSVLETDDSSNRVRVSVEFDRPIEKSQVRAIQLTCEHQLLPRETGGDPVAELAGFGVEGAARQSGYIGVKFSDVWRPRINEVSKVHRIFQMPTGFREAGVRGSNAFQFLGQPCSLKMSVSARQRRVQTESTHILDVEPGRLTLESRIRYTISGRHLDVCSGIFPGWEIEGVTMIDDGVVELIDFLPPTESRLDIDLPREMRSEFELRVVASQVIPEDSDFFVVNLPTIDEEHRSPPELIVVADDQLEVMADLDRSLGLSESDQASSLAFPERLYPPQVYLINDDSTSFAADVTRRAQQIMVSSQAQVRVRLNSLLMEQTLLYNVRHGSLATIELAVPAWWENSDAIRVAIDGNEVKGVSTPSEANGGSANLALPLEKPRIGAIEVTIAYEIATSDPPPNEETTSTIFFASPAAADYVAPFDLVVEAPQEIEVSFDDADLRARDVPEDDQQTHSVWQSASIPMSCDLLLTHQYHNVPESIVIERAWIQTWLTATVRQDRAVFKLLTNRPDVVFELPSVAHTGNLMVMVDGKAFSAEPNEGGLLQIDLPDRELDEDLRELRGYVVEIGWNRVLPYSVLRDVACEFPLVQDGWLKEVRWNIVTPRNQLVLTTPGEMTGDLLSPLSWWQKDEQPSQHDFEQWVGASSQPSPESVSQLSTFRRYSFASVGPPGGKAAFCVSGSFAALVVIGIALGCGGAFLHFRRLRHPGVILAVGLALVSLAVSWPAVALVAGQSIALVVCVIVLSRLLQLPLGSLNRQRGQRRRVVTPASAIRVRPSTRIQGEPVLSGPSTTANAGAGLPMDTPS